MRTIGSVPYLNARPLVAWFTRTEEGRASGYRVIEAPPSQLATMLERGEIACGLLSSVELFRRPEFGYVPGIGIAADGAVESVRLFSRIPLDQVRSVALDTSSLTSVAMLKILLWRVAGVSPSFVPMAPDGEAMLAACDAALLIGDRGFAPVGSAVEVVDLGAMWKAWTGLPFVYALWIGPKSELDADLEQTLVRAAEWGMSRIAEIASSTAADHGTDPARALHYLRDVMRFALTPPMGVALERFGELVAESDLACASGSTEDDAWYTVG